MNRSGLDYTPHYNAFEHAKIKGGKYLKKYLRNTSSSYIKKPAVRDYVFKKYKNSCCSCGSRENLHIDHINPVFNATVENICTINSIDNLRLLCKSCNSRRGVNAETLQGCC
jgi:5-methylcytosine-specific restriction endonuclease McrA